MSDDTQVTPGWFMAAFAVMGSFATWVATWVGLRARVSSNSKRIDKHDEAIASGVRSHDKIVSTIAANTDTIRSDMHQIALSVARVEEHMDIHKNR